MKRLFAVLLISTFVAGLAVAREKSNVTAQQKANLKTELKAAYEKAKVMKADQRQSFVNTEAPLMLKRTTGLSDNALIRCYRLALMESTYEGMMAHADNCFAMNAVW